jgi:hypothetical protein
LSSFPADRDERAALNRSSSSFPIKRAVVLEHDGDTSVDVLAVPVDNGAIKPNDVTEPRLATNGRRRVAEIVNRLFIVVYDGIFIQVNIL